MDTWNTEMDVYRNECIKVIMDKCNAEIDI